MSVLPRSSSVECAKKRVRGISVQARDELVSGVREDAQADGDEAWAPVARPVADCGARAGESDLILERFDGHGVRGVLVPLPTLASMRSGDPQVSLAGRPPGRRNWWVRIVRAGWDAR